VIYIQGGNPKCWDDDELEPERATFGAAAVNWKFAVALVASIMPR
jgi:hypothetical protein